jgi:peroxiredoxin Q/BCP
MKKFLNIIICIFSLGLFRCGGNAQTLSIGQDAPDFSLEDDNNVRYTLSDFRGKSPVVIYFYPKAGTPSCTKQACGIRDNFSKFVDNSIPIFGISVDSKESLKKFREEHNLNFPLLSDSNKIVSKAYDVLNNLGFSNRITFIIDKEGKIAHILKNIDVNEHANQVFDLANKLK